MKKIKILCLLLFIGVAYVGLTKKSHFVHTTIASSSGPPPGVTGAPGEANCAVCHFAEVPGGGQFTITAPQNYNPGQTYQIVVRHTTADTTRRRWGFQLTSLAGTTIAGTVTDTSGNTQTLNGGNGRFYTQHTTTGTFAGQTGGAVWTFNWTAPATNLGPVTFYAAGNQANNNGNSDGDQIFTTSATSPPAALSQPDFDFDGDGKSDVSVFRPSDGVWYLLNSTSGFSAAQFGISTDKLVPADYDGDGKTDVAVFRDGGWFLLRSSAGFTAVSFGQAGDIPHPADFDGDGKADITVFRPSTGGWYRLNSSNGQFVAVAFGTAEDKPTIGDFDGDGKADIAVFRPSASSWYRLNSSNNQFVAVQFGAAEDKLVPADYDGDTKTDIAVYRPSTGGWYRLNSSNGEFVAVGFGTGEDKAVAADYDGDGKADIAVFRPSEANWYLLRSTEGFAAVQFGQSNDKPVPNAYVP